jgi:hypothetical protein
MSQYNYTKTPVSVDSLTKQIQSSAIITAIDHIELFGAALSIFFKADLSEGDVLLLNNIVSSHNGIPLPENEVKVVQVDSSPPFASKTILVSGVSKKLYKRVHGIQQDCVVGDNILEFTIPYPQAKITGIEMIGGANCDIVRLLIKDTPTGTYSTVPNYTLNQFGFNVNVAGNYYQHTSEYDADLFLNMKIHIIYTAQVAGKIGINFILNELK